MSVLAWIATGVLAFGCLTLGCLLLILCMCVVARDDDLARDRERGRS